MITYGSQKIFKTDSLFLKESLNSKKISQGKYCLTFEKKLKEFFDVKYLTLSNSGTSAIHLGLESLNLKKGSIIIMPAITFVATLSIASKLGHKVYLADIDFETGQISKKTIIECINRNKIKPDVIITMYMGGYVYELKEIYSLKKKYKCIIFEDACHAFGSEYFDKKTKKRFKIGSCKYSDVCTFSFHPLKTITTGEGGCLTTNNKKIAKRANLLASHGMEKNINNHTIYNVRTFGYNFRMSDLNAALGISQLKNIKTILLSRKKIYENYQNNLKNIDFVKENKQNISSYHLFIIKIKNKRKLLSIMKQNKIFCQYHYIPLYRFSVFKQNKKNLENSEKYFKHALSIPIHLGIKLNNQKKIIKILNKFIEKN